MMNFAIQQQLVLMFQILKNIIVLNKKLHIIQTLKAAVVSPSMKYVYLYWCCYNFWCPNGNYFYLMFFVPNQNKKSEAARPLYFLFKKKCC